MMDTSNTSKNLTVEIKGNINKDKNMQNESRSPKMERSSKGTGERRTAVDFYFGKLIGEGSFSNVFLAKDIHTNHEYAVKVCEQAHIKREKKVESIVREREVMDIINTNRIPTAPFFVKLSYAFTDSTKLYFVMTYCPKGELLELIQRVGNFDRECVRFYTAEIVRALEHLHSLKIIHRDLKPENILLDQNMHIKISDFGSSKILSKVETEKTEDMNDASSVKETSQASTTSVAGEPLGGEVPAGVVTQAPLPAGEDSIRTPQTEFLLMAAFTHACICEARAPGCFQSYINEYYIANNVKYKIVTPTPPREVIQSFHEFQSELGASTVSQNEAARNVSWTSSCSSPPRRTSSGYGRPRKSSFVGTAQYVSPELLESKNVGPWSDLWALGCIIYQMVSGLPPFRSRSEYLIFQKILKLEYEFPNGFDEDAKDLVQKLLVIECEGRLGARDIDGYPSIRSHPLLEGLNFDTLHEQTPPEICMPEVEAEPNLWENHREPGLGNELELLLGTEIKPGQSIQCQGQSIEIGDETKTETSVKSAKRNIADVGKEETAARLTAQERDNQWHRFVEGNLILKHGLIDKRKGLFPRRRMFLLTTGPHLYYIDPVNMVLKGEIPWDPAIAPEAKNFKTFFVHTPNRTYYLEDPSAHALEWCRVIEEVKKFYYKDE